MGKKYGTAEITVEKKSNEEIHTIIWTVPEVLRVISGDVSDTNFYPKLIETTPKTFKLSMEVYVDSSLTIDYKSPTPVTVKSVKLKMFTFDLRNWTHSEREETIMKSEHLLVNANKWRSLGELSYKDDYPAFFTESDEQKLCLLSEGKLRLTVEFVVTTRNNIIYNIPDSQLCNDLRKLYLEGIHSDVVMRSEDGEEFKVHKGVLASRSEVLKAHFEHKTQESITNTVTSPMKSDVIREVLSYIYTDKLSDDNVLPEKLLVAADFYQLTRLKSICEKALFEELNVDNAIEILQLADLYSANELKKLTLEFIKRDNNKVKIYKTAGWANLKSVELIKIISE